MKEVRTFTTGTQRCEKEACEKLVKKKYLVFCESMDTKLKEHSLHISKTLNNFETESQMFTVIAVHEILVPLGVPV